MAAKKATATKKSTPAKKANSTAAPKASSAGKKADPATKSTPAKKSTTTTKAATNRAATNKAATNKAASKKSAPAKKSSSAVKKSTPAKKTPAKKTTARKGLSVPEQSSVSTQAARLVVREDESPWTAAELEEVRTELEGEIQRLREEISTGETDLSEFLKEPINGAGDDQADAGSKSFEREHELSLAANARTGLEQNVHALHRLEDGTYGLCEVCGNPIGKLRLQAYPRATLCLSCKSRQERR